MGQIDRCVLNFVSPFGIVLAFFLGTAGVGHSQNIANYPAAQSRPGVSYLDQGWGYDTAEWWYHISQGTVFMPYQWFVALEQASGDALFRFRRDRWFESGSSSGESDERPTRPLSP